MQCYGFELPEKSLWLQRIQKYVIIPGFPAELQIIVAEYGSSFVLILAAVGTLKNTADTFGTFAIESGLDSIEPFTNIPHMRSDHAKTFRALFTCRTGLYKGRIEGRREIKFDQLSNHMWYHRIPGIYSHPVNCKTKVNPNGDPWRGCGKLPRDAYFIYDNDSGNMVENFEECSYPRVVMHHDIFSFAGKLTFRNDTF